MTLKSLKTLSHNINLFILALKKKKKLVESILKTKLGECSNVYEQINESIQPQPDDLNKFNQSDKEIFIWKDPIVRNRGEWNHSSIIIIRNPSGTKQHKWRSPSSWRHLILQTSSICCRNPKRVVGIAK